MNFIRLFMLWKVIFILRFIFFIGQFKALTNELKSLFQFEQILYSFAKKEMGKDRVFTLEKVFPLYLLKKYT